MDGRGGGWDRMRQEVRVDGKGDERMGEEVRQGERR